MGDLQGAVNDAKAFESFLLDELAVPATNMTVLLDDKATRENILTTIYSHFLNNHNILDGGNTAMIFYFVGHGTRINAPESLPSHDGMVEAICPVDARTTDASGNYVHTIPDYVLGRLLRELLQRKAQISYTLIFDCCHSGDMGRDEDMARTASSISVPLDLDSHLWKGKTEIMQSYPPAASDVLLAACWETAQEIRHDHDKSVHGRFTDGLIPRLPNTPRARLLNLLNLSPTWSGQTPPCVSSNRDHPVFGGNYPVTGRRVFTLTPDTSVNPKDPYTVQSFWVEKGSVEGVTIHHPDDIGMSLSAHIASRGKCDRRSATSVPRRMLDLINALKSTLNVLPVLTTFFTCTATEILRIIRADNETKDVTGATMTAFNFSAYAAIILNLLATAVSVSLVYQLRHITRNEIRTGGNRFIEGDVDTVRSGLIEGDIDTVRPGLGAGWMLQFLFMLVILCTVLGILFIFGEILIYVLLCDRPVMSLVLTGLTVSTMAILAWTFTRSYRTPRVSHLSVPKRNGGPPMVEGSQGDEMVESDWGDRGYGLLEGGRGGY
ncbi:caspase domain-containing protein [Mycena olivaceomarginata]|nr:caspase domain-containing protein [Mycena olivaceomarginata]